MMARDSCVVEPLKALLVGVIFAILLAGELLEAATPGSAGGESTSGPAPAVAAGPQSIEEVLQLKTKVAFDAESLEFCMRDLLHDAHKVAKGSPFAKGGPKELALKIIGIDLQMDGITRNMTIRDFNQEGTIAEVLTALVLKGNPEAGKPAHDPRQKLLWVIGPDPDNPERQTILITTRAAAAKKKYTLPAEFQEKGK